MNTPPEFPKEPPPGQENDDRMGEGKESHASVNWPWILTIFGTLSAVAGVITIPRLGSWPQITVLFLILFIVSYAIVRGGLASRAGQLDKKFFVAIFAVTLLVAVFASLLVWEVKTATRADLQRLRQENHNLKAQLAEKPSTPQRTGERELNFNKGPYTTDQGIQLSDFRVSSENKPPRLGDRITLTFVLKNGSELPQTFAVIHGAARTPAGKNLHFSNNARTLQPGEAAMFPHR